MPRALLAALGLALAPRSADAHSVQMVLHGTKGYTAALANPDTGKVTPAGPLTLPDAAAGCKWSLGEPGTVGQTSTAFVTNSSWFMMAQELCGTTVKRTMLVDIFGIFPPGPEGDLLANKIAARSGAVDFRSSARPSPAARPVGFMGDFAKYSTKPLVDWNIAWDWSCNVIVIVPEETASEATFATLQVSEYDLAVRPQPDLLSFPVGCTDCWVKVNTGVGLQLRQSPDGEPQRTQEESCGDSCVLYVVEQYVDADGKPTLPRRIVGRTYRTGKVVSNVTDTVNAATLTYGNPFGMAWESGKSGLAQPWDPDTTYPFYGIGTCCAESYCPTECHAHAGSLVLFAWQGMSKPIVVLAVLGVDSSDKEAAHDAISLGVVVDPAAPWVFANKKIVTYAVKSAGGGSYTAKLNGTSPALDVTPVAWSLAPFM